YKPNLPFGYSTNSRVPGPFPGPLSPTSANVSRAILSLRTCPPGPRPVVPRENDGTSHLDISVSIPTLPSTSFIPPITPLTTSPNLLAIELPSEVIPSFTLSLPATIASFILLGIFLDRKSTRLNSSHVSI